MKDYVFFFNDKSYRLLELNKLDKPQAEELSNQGFARADFQAENRTDAIKRANEITGINTKSLKDFSGDIGFSAIIESLLR